MIENRGRVTPRDRTITLRDGGVAFRVLSAGRGAPLVYFHSFHERGGWSPFLGRLCARHTVYAPFHPGVAGSTGVETLDDLLDLTLAYDELLEALGIEAAALVGHFFGAMVAAEVAAVFPRRARGLVLVSPLGLWRDDAPVADVVILPHDDLMSVLWADADRVNPLPYAEEWQRRIKGAALSVLPGGHMVIHEAPDAAASAVEE